MIVARGKPAVWSTLLGVPFLAVGAYLYWLHESGLVISGMTIPPSDLRLLSAPIAVFGGFILLIGLYIQFVAAPSGPRLQEGEEIVRTQHPSQTVALVKVAIGAPALVGAGYLLFFTVKPYVYPTVALVIGLYFFSSGLKIYWTNTLTTYYITTHRVLKEYRFLSLRRQEIPLEKIRAVDERKSLTEAMVGLGNIQIASGGGGGSVSIMMRNINDSTGFADKLRTLI